MDALATGIGWGVLIIGAIWVLGTVVERWDESKREALRKPLEIRDHAARIAARQIYFGTSDEKIKELVKYSYGSWAWLYLDLDDSSYHSKMLCSNDYDSANYQSALHEIKERGMPLYLEDGQIKRKW